MKKLFLTLASAMLINFIWAQAPDAFKYQAAVRNTQGQLIANQNISLRISILQGSTNGNVVFSETHNKSTNDFGLVNLELGKGNVVSGNIATINWKQGPYFLGIELDETGGTNYVALGVAELLSVPYALHAKTVDMADDADADPTNELQNLFLSGDTLKISQGMGVILPVKSLWQNSEQNIYYNGGNVGIGSDKPETRLEVHADANTAPDDAIFQVINLAGDTVFAVYPGGVRINIDNGLKGNRGGFAVGGLSSGGKQLNNEFLRVTPDSVRIYVDTSTLKGNRGGFAVGGLSSGGKNNGPEFLRVTPDSVRIYVKDKPVKGNRGGFAVGGLSSGGKGDPVGFLYLTRDNYFIGENAGFSNVSGIDNVFLGTEAGFSNLDGSSNIFLGTEAGHENTSGVENVFLGLGAGYANTTGSWNVFIGLETGLSNIDGSWNIFQGTRAGFSNTSGNENVFMGLSSGYYNKGGSYNIFMGNNSGYSNTEGHDNVFLGLDAGYANDTGSYNIFIGNEAGFSNTFGEENLFMGSDAGWFNETGSYNIFLGNDAGHSNTIGEDNVFVGNGTGFSNSSGYSNVYIGNNAGYNSDTAVYNVFLGNYAGTANTYGSSNVFIGDAVGESNTIGNGNVFIGDWAGAQNISGESNVFLGAEAGWNNTIGNYNVFLGSSAGYNNIDGEGNVFLGDDAGFSNTNGLDNVFLGGSSGYSNVDGAGNVFLGSESGSSNTSGSWNIFMGGESGWSNTLGNDNVFIGTAAGYNNQAGHANLFVGSDAGFYNISGSDNIFIGTSAGYYETGSEKLYISNWDADSTQSLVFGNFADELLQVNYYLGVGRYPSLNELEVEGDASKTTAGSWLANSDRRIKTNIKDIENPFEAILKLHPVKFKYTDEWKATHKSIEDKYYYNFIAQEYQDVFPESVKGSGEYLEGDNKEILQIDTYNAQIVTIKAVQDLIKQNMELSEKVRQLEIDNKNLKAEVIRINNIEEKVDKLQKAYNATIVGEK